MSQFVEYHFLTEMEIKSQVIPGTSTLIITGTLVIYLCKQFHDSPKKTFGGYVLKGPFKLMLGEVVLIRTHLNLLQ